MISEKEITEALTESTFWSSYLEAKQTMDGETRADACIMQNPAEIFELIKWIGEHDIKSYFEVGVWTGDLVSLLEKIFNFKFLAACDLGTAKEFGLEITIPSKTKYFEGNYRSPIFPSWRKNLGMIDLTFIDTDHEYANVKKEFEITRANASRYIALHGIAGGKLVGDGVKKLWNELRGTKHEIILPFPGETSDIKMGIGIWSE